MTITTPTRLFAHLDTEDLRTVFEAWQKILVLGRTETGHRLSEAEEYAVSVHVGKMREELRERKERKGAA